MSKLPDSISALLSKREFALSLKQIDKQQPLPTSLLRPWRAYCAFHAKNYKIAIQVLHEIIEHDGEDTVLRAYLAACYYHMGKFQQCLLELGDQDFPESSCYALRTRIRLLVAARQKRMEDSALYRQRLGTSYDDQLAIAACDFVIGDYDEAVERYTRMLQENGHFAALHVFLALCQFKMRNHLDTVLPCLEVYAAEHPTSLISCNLKACVAYVNASDPIAVLQTQFRLDNMEAISGKEHLELNIPVFKRDGSGLEAWSSLMEMFPEARLNMAVLHLQRGEPDEALQLIQSIHATRTDEKNILAAALLLVAMKRAPCAADISTLEEFTRALSILRDIGANERVCDTILGRCALATVAYFEQQFALCACYLESLQQYLKDDVFLWNYGIVSALAGDYLTAARVLRGIQDEEAEKSFLYKKWLLQSYVFSGNPEQAWSLRLQVTNIATATRVCELLCKDCFAFGAFGYAVKAFAYLETAASGSDNAEQAREMWIGKLASAVGLILQVFSGDTEAALVQDAYDLLKQGQWATHEETRQVLTVLDELRDRWQQLPRVPFVRSADFTSLVTQPTLPASVQAILPLFTRVSPAFTSLFQPSDVDGAGLWRVFVPPLLCVVHTPDARIAIPRPDEEPDWLGLMLLDEPVVSQLDPHLISPISVLPRIARPSYRRSATMSRQLDPILASLRDSLDPIFADTTANAALRPHSSSIMASTTAHHMEPTARPAAPVTVMGTELPFMRRLKSPASVRWSHEASPLSPLSSVGGTARSSFSSVPSVAAAAVAVDVTPVIEVQVEEQDGMLAAAAWSVAPPEW
eukprot:TRINITY_DN7021_c0_g6_i1.p1 TRINITY_DN7021_c0_g6~~TRINITY_DN7021_c0_g6_i1.p1  ORF type:complete len:809 (+),score=183.29 TRINITY_DN7021_c0_g6_i1:79-2505(+)